MLLLTLTSTKNGSWHRVHLLHGGIGKVPSGLRTIQKVKEEASQVLNERGDPLLEVRCRKPPKMAFKNSIYFVTDGSCTADFCSAVTDGVCEDNASNDPFSRCKTVQQFGYR